VEAETARPARRGGDPVSGVHSTPHPVDPLAVVRPQVRGFAIDHRKVARGDVFGAFQGEKVNGEDFIAEAIARGAVAVVARPEAVVEGALHVASSEPRRTFAVLAAGFFAPFPDTCVAVTGTNGKTSTTEILRQLWQRAGFSAASMGTLGITTGREGEIVDASGMTTPDIVTFLSSVAGLQREGVSHLAFEASSHGLAQYRTEGLPVRAAGFTNLSRDHLDYHNDMESYFRAKLRLFSEVLDADGTAVVWRDHAAPGAEYADRMLAVAEARGLRLFSVGPDGDTVRLLARTPTASGQILHLLLDDIAFGEMEIELPLIGGYQAANALVAAGLAMATGLSPAATLRALERVQGVRGRLERAVVTKTGASVYVDYAHTPDGLESAIDALRPHTSARLILVFGCGGDRDRGKRPEMGAIAVRDADIAIVTDDNPRGEDAAAIRAEILGSAPGAIEVADRRAAIGQALAMAKAGDTVLLAGKGHEQGQIIGQDVHPFDDVQVAREQAV